MITHLSVSQLQMFQRCGEQYRRRYIEEEIVPPGITVARQKSGGRTRSIIALRTMREESVVSENSENSEFGEKREAVC